MNLYVLSCSGGECLEKQIFAFDFLLLHEVVQEGRFSYICVSHQGHHWCIVVSAPRLLLIYFAKTCLLLNLFSYACLFVPNLPSLHLQLRFTFTAHCSRSSALSGRNHLHLHFLRLHEVTEEKIETGGIGGSIADETSPEVAEVAEFYLQSRQFGGGCISKKYIAGQRSAI